MWILFSYNLFSFHCRQFTRRTIKGTLSRENFAVFLPPAAADEAGVAPSPCWLAGWSRTRCAIRLKPESETRFMVEFVCISGAATAAQSSWLYDSPAAQPGKSPEIGGALLDHTGEDRIEGFKCQDVA